MHQTLTRRRLPAPPAAPARRPTHTHQIRIETEEPGVTVRIGDDRPAATGAMSAGAMSAVPPADGAPAAVPGGFAKVFNRVVDGGAWAGLPDAARACYLPLVRHADAREGFRVQVGQAALIRLTGLSRSSVKRGMKALLDSRLVVVVAEGGVTDDNRNESNVYQLLVPPAPTRPAADAGHDAPADAYDDTPVPARCATVRPPAQRPPAAFDAEPESFEGDEFTHDFDADNAGAGSPVDLPPVRGRTPSPSGGGPTARPPSAPRSDLRRSPAPVRRWAEPPSAGGPLLRATLSDPSNPPAAAHRGSPTPPTQTPPARPARSTGGAAADSVELLLGAGVSADVAAGLAEAYPAGRIAEVVETMEYRRERGTCGNPGGFVREALRKKWPVPRAVLDRRERAEADRRRAATEERSRRRAESERASAEAVALADEARVESAVASLDDDELAELAAAVVDRHRDNPAVVAVLTRRPPRQCRLMKMEVAAMLKA